MLLLLISRNLVEGCKRYQNTKSKAFGVQNLIVWSKGPMHAQAGYVAETSMETFWMQHNYLLVSLGMAFSQSKMALGIFISL